MRKTLLALIISATLLTGCATIPQPQTKSEVIGYFNGLIAATATTLKNLLDTNKISVKTAKTISTNLHLAAQELDIAQNATNTTQASSLILAASTLLNSVQAQLTNSTVEIK